MMNDYDFRQLIGEIKANTDLVKLIGEDIELSASGSSFKGSSPWNRDRTPSFVVWHESQRWHDYSGGGDNGGDCFEYMIQKEGCTFMEAVRLLADRAGLDTSALTGSVTDEQAADARERHETRALLTSAAAYYHHALPEDVRVGWYQQKYGFSDQTIDRFKLGWADGELYEHMSGTLNISDTTLLSTGLFVQFNDGRIVDFFQGRLVFPYLRHGEVCYLAGRQTEQTPDKPWERNAKYKKLLTHSARQPYVSKQVTNDTFFNEDAARGAKTLLITEGITDCISAAQAGIACISPATTSFRRKDHGKLLALTARADRVTICNDSEKSGAGEAGAIETATALHTAGRSVQMATIPLPDGSEKIDVNELVATQGADALFAVLDDAVDLPAFLLSRIPADTPKPQLKERLEPVLKLLTDADAIARDEYANLIASRFGLRISIARDLVRPSKEQKPAGESAAAPRGAGPGLDLFGDQKRKGEVFEDQDKSHYFIEDKTGAPLAVSSFLVNPTRLVRTDEGDIVEADLVTDRGTVFRGVRFPKQAWHSSRCFLGHLPHLDLQWTGSDENVQGVQRLVASKNLAVKQGTTNLGYHESSDGACWVTPGGVLRADGHEVLSEEIVYVESGHSLGHRVSYRTSTPDVELEAARLILPLLLELNTQEVMLPIIGWFFAAPLKPHIRRLLGHFPLLFVWGTQGCGKSSLITEVFWPLLGVGISEPYSATETEFALIRLLSATNSVPVFIDEYKPFDMARHRRDTLHRYMRRLYCGEVEERGRADQTVNTYRLAAPLCVAGETRPTESALMERILTAHPDKDQILRDPRHQQAFDRIRSRDPNLLAGSIITFLLGTDVAAGLDHATIETDQLLDERDVPHRVRDNIKVMLFGLQCYATFALKHGIELPKIELRCAVDAMLDDLLECGGMAVKTALDYFLEELSVMAISKSIECEQNYVWTDQGLAIHFPSCHASYKEHCRRIGSETEAANSKALRVQISESFNRGGYVVGISELTSFRGRDDRRRAVIIDIEKAQQTLVLDGFAGGH